MSGLLARRPDQAGRRALGLYDDAPLTARVHTTIRWFTCPFPATAAFVPDEGRVLEVGCGHGLFSAYLALQRPTRDVTGIDIDADKIAIATCAAERANADGAHLHLAAADSARMPAGPWDAIVFVDVLYLLSRDAQRDLLAKCSALLDSDGVIVVKEMGTEPRWKARWNRVQETLSVRVLRITEGETLDFLSPEQIAGWLREHGLDVQVTRLDRGRLHPHTVVVGRRMMTTD